MDDPQYISMELLTVSTTHAADLTLTPNSSASYNSSHETYNTFAYKIIIPVVWGLIIFIGAVGNIIVVFTMCSHGGRSMPRSTTNCYIINVALADLAFLSITVPITIAHYVSYNWVYGEIMCKFQNYIAYVSLLSTCLTLTAMTIDRYFAIVHPIRSLHSRTPRGAAIICIAIWLASGAACSPYLMVFGLELKNSQTVCMRTWSLGWEKAMTVMVVLVTYVVPLSVILVSYTFILRFLWQHRIGVRKELDHDSDSTESVIGVGTTIARRRKKVAKMVAVVVILFAITWLPIHLFNLCYALIPNFPQSQPLYDLKIFAHTLSYTSSCINPFVYTIMGDGFRKAFRESLCGCRGGSPSYHSRPSYPRRSGSTIETRLNGE
ncbi:galanin receptor 2a-like [Physella acuta]|uniref:galanin receptor 2a-like n=1 Tax=Physella acuta TaxID=109671 RepID=UPI0027DC6568|nr:galanin receptor 2a-like [Physella acuta]XP_059165803.1 galanin receptor 2a-like [Physella acuta]